MAVPVIMPQLGNSVESCIITKWHKKKGDEVNLGDILFTYETDKTALEEEAKSEGVLLGVFFEEEEDVPVLTNVCVIGNEGEDVSEFAPGTKSNARPEAINQSSAAPEGITGKGAIASDRPQGLHLPPGLHLPHISISDPKETKISPRARNLAEKTGVDYRYASPTGPYGRIIEQDIEGLLKTGHIMTPAAKQEYSNTSTGLMIDQMIEGTGLGGRVTTADLLTASSADGSVSADVKDKVAYPGKTSYPSKTVHFDAEILQYQKVKPSNIRKVIAKTMHHSLSSTAQLTLNASFDATGILDYRKKLKEKRETLGLENITLNDIMLYAVSRTLLHCKELNAHFVEGELRLFNNVHLGVAVDTDRGLMVPTIFNANLKSLNEISRESKSLIEKCKEGTINPDCLKNANFTVTNLGTLGIESFTPILNPPQTGILGVNTIIQRVREVNEEYVYYPAMGLSLTFDHRALDGAPAAIFLKNLRTSLESFSILLAK